MNFELKNLKFPSSKLEIRIRTTVGDCICICVVLKAVSWTSLPRSHGRQCDASDTQCWPVRNRVQKSARHRCSCTLGRSHAAKPRIPAMIQDAVWAGLLPEHLLETRLAAVIETAASTHLSALGDEDWATPSCMFRKRPRQQTKSGRRTVAANNSVSTGPASRTRQWQNLNIPVRLLKMTTAKIWIFLRPLGRADSVNRSSKRGFHGCLTGTGLRRLKNTLNSKGAWQQVTRIEELCHTHVSHKWLYHFAHDHITNVQKRLGNRTWPPTWTRRNLQHSRSHSGAQRMHSRRLWRA